MDPSLRESVIPSSGLFPQRGNTKAVKQPFNTEEILRGNYMSTTKQQDTEVNDEETTFDYLTIKDDIQRPAKLDLIIGFLRLFNFLSVSTSIFAVIISILFPIQQKETITLNLWQIKTFQ